MVACAGTHFAAPVAIGEDVAMTADPRAVTEYRIPAGELRPGDLVNTSPGEDDWQEVLRVHKNAGSARDEGMKKLIQSVAGRYVVVELTDLAPVDSGVEVGEDGATIVSDSGLEHPVTDVVSADDGTRVYLYTRYELVTVRATS
jgi:hypothetical protein